jgi:hypothetical protein
LYLSCDQMLYVSLKKTKKQVSKYKENDNLKKCSNQTYNELLESAIHKLRQPFLYVLIRIWVSIKGSIDIRSHLRIVAYKRKLLLI